MSPPPPYVPACSPLLALGTSPLESFLVRLVHRECFLYNVRFSLFFGYTLRLIWSLIPQNTYFTNYYYSVPQLFVLTAIFGVPQLFVSTFLNIDSYVKYRKKWEVLYGTVLYRYVYGTHGTPPILQGVGGIKLRCDNLSPRNNGCNHWIQRKI